MNALVVVENTERWQLELPGARVVSAKDYLLDTLAERPRRPTVFNLCRSYGYQTTGYYVSLLAAARGHRPMPSVETIQDLRSPAVLRIVSKDMDDLIQRSLRGIQSEEFELSVYFGRNVAKRYDRLGQALFNQFPAPLLRAAFEYDGSWRLASVRPVGTKDIPESHREFIVEQAARYFARPKTARQTKQEYRYDIAILWRGETDDAPSDEKAIKKFVRAARECGMDPTIIGSDDVARVAEFDALFIRDTTFVNHYTFRVARKAEAAGLVVIDDSASILRCTNKIFQAEAFAKHGVPHPRTMVVHPTNVDQVPAAVGLPCVLKRPDSAFSQGVVKVTTPEELRTNLEEFYEDSELVIAQEFVSSGFDWRVGVLDGRALYAARYHMARGHWQIVRTSEHGTRRYGKVEVMAVEDAPAAVVQTAVRAAALMGTGLYGVDLKEIDGRVLVMEVNDNPNIDAGYEDTVLKDGLYRAIMRYFRDRLDARGVPGS